MTFWEKVAECLRKRVRETAKAPKPNSDKLPKQPNDGQRDTLSALAKRLPKHGAIIADAVGMGKTLIAAEVARAVIESGGRVAILVPSGLGAQWQLELRDVGIVDTQDILRSYGDFHKGIKRMNADESGRTWLDEKVLLISHGFANWRLGENSDKGSYSLLPVMFEEWSKRETRRERGCNKRDCCYVAVANRCLHISDTVAGRYMATQFKKLEEKIPAKKWGINNGKNYSKDSKYRELLEKCVGMILGQFDLVIVDEAHKSRREDSLLSRYLQNILLRKRHCRFLSMTATPVELDPEQWESILLRIGADAKSAEDAVTAATGYIAAVKKLQEGAWKKNENLIDEFVESARKFSEIMEPWLLLRTKAEDENVQKFKRLAKTDNTYAYHDKKEVTIAIEDLDTKWQKAVCAAEALSLASRNSENISFKRLRLTIGSGYGIAMILDSSKKDQDAKLDENEAYYERAESEEDLKGKEIKNAVVDDGEQTDKLTKKRFQRICWWQDLLQNNFGEQESLYEHPAIVKAVECIEKITSDGEKVLVFGTYKKPLKALNDLLNAREIVRCFKKEISLPFEKIPEDLEPAVEAKLEQSGENDNIDDVNKWLKNQYRNQENLRTKFKDRLIETLDKSLASEESKMSKDGKMSEDIKIANIFLDAMKKDREKKGAGKNQEQEVSPYDYIVRALEEILGERSFAEGNSVEVADAFKKLVGELCTCDESGSGDNGELDERQTLRLLRNIVSGLKDDYNPKSPRGHFSRMLFGTTKHPSRRTAQLAFNREKSRLRVLVAQSLVGREGLNLHEACRQVLLLHPEWNPGVVEQQIGRVDRVGSYWATKKLKKYEGDIPKIILHCLVFKGTYDEHHWNVLDERRAAYRAQFYGEIIQLHEQENLTEDEKRKLERIIKATPSFSPSKKRIRKSC